MGAAAATQAGNAPEALRDCCEEIAVPGGGVWSQATAARLQEAVDRIFGTPENSLLGLEFSFSIADPFLPDCPLIGCSIGFTTLCGYDLPQVVGHNCRFLLDSVPDDRIDLKMRKHTKEWCMAIKEEKPWMPPADYAYAPKGIPTDELVSMQTNRRKDGTLFNNLFYMKVFDISPELGDERPYIVALQTDMGEGTHDLTALARNLIKLDANMNKVKAELSSQYFMQCSMSRQLSPEHSMECSMSRQLTPERSMECSMSRQ